MTRIISIKMQCNKSLNDLCEIQYSEALMPNLKQIIYIFLIFQVSIMAQKVTPVKMKVDLNKNCEVLMLHMERDKKSRTTHTFAGRGDCVMMYECVRNISSEALEKMAPKERRIAKWENPVWCKVKVGHKEGWVEEQFLADEPCVSDE